MVYIFLAEGFEEIEFTAPADILRRAEIDVKTVGIGGLTITGAHGIRIMADVLDSDMRSDMDFDMIVLPGGMPGAAGLDSSDVVDKFISAAVKQEKLIGAICAAPFILGKRNILLGKKAVCYPGFENELKGCEIQSDLVVTDGNIITAKGPGAAVDFGLELVRHLRGAECSNKIRESMQCTALI